MNVVAVIPARMASTRFPGKPLALICGKPMIQHVYEHASACPLIGRVVVAADDMRVSRTVRSFGGEVCMTSTQHQTGTDRVAEVARGINADIVVNLQGDEPLLPADAMAEAIRPLLADPGLCMATLKTQLRSADDPADPNIVKVVTDRHGQALYFSRSPLPFMRSPAGPARLYRHIGLYAFKRSFLLAYSSLQQTPLEIAESLEQLRALEHGHTIYVAETRYYPLGVDVPADIARAETAMQATA
jgi:3-deoxy-manno-octulosonate cytidylyltransferase (CMP-KDO synthetase)